MPEMEQLIRHLSPPLAAVLKALDGKAVSQLEEIRVYAGRRVELSLGDACMATEVTLDAGQMDELLAALCGYAVYSCEQQMAEGFLPLPGGHRAGLCGKLALENGQWRMHGIRSVCIRVSHHIPDASRSIRRHLLSTDGQPVSVLLLGPPGCGKTTVLRDAALWLSEARHLHVAVADEREELFGESEGLRLDVMGGADKARMLRMLLRSAAPQVLLTDEIGRMEDTEALLDALRCGVGVLASAHAGSMEEAMKRPLLGRLLRERAFDRYLLLGHHGRLIAAYDAEGREME